MKTSTTRTQYLRLPLLLAGLAFAGHPLSAITLSDPSLFAPNYSGNAKVTQSAAGATAASAIDALDGFWVVRDFTGFTTGSNSITFTPGDLPGIQFSFSGSIQSDNTGNEIANTTFTTSGSSAVRIQANTTNAATLGGLIDFTGAGVNAAAFTLAGNRFARVADITVNFLSETSAILSTQTYTGTGSTSTVGLYFGYEAVPGQTIGGISISVTLNSGSETVVFGLDDLGFSTSTIPEPAAAATLAGAAGLLLTIVRRPRR